MRSDASVIANTAPAAPDFPEARQHALLGIVMLDTRFPRPLGDVGHPDTFGVPVLHRTLAGAWPASVVVSAASLRANGLAPRFRDAVIALERAGAGAIVTSCGFLVLLQDELQSAVKVPVVTSSLVQLPGILANERQVGVLTIDARQLGATHLLAAGVPRERLNDVLIEGVDRSGEFARVILGNLATMDLDRAQADVVRAALQLRARAPLLRSVVLECTNMPPYAEAVRAATEFDLRWLQHVPALRAAFPIENSEIHDIPFPK